MKSVVETLRPNDALDLADEVMALDRIRHLPVVDENNRVIGVVSQRDLFQRALAAALGYGEISHQKLLHTIAAKEVMSEPAVTVSSAATVKEAGQLMLQKRIGCLPVVENGVLAGIVTETDIVRELVGPGVEENQILVTRRA
jgi:CBS domain-containing protein